MNKNNLLGDPVGGLYLNLRISLQGSLQRLINSSLLLSLDESLWDLFAEFNDGNASMSDALTFWNLLRNEVNILIPNHTSLKMGDL